MDMYDTEAYRKGWRYARRDGDLDTADRKGYTRSNDWCDGYADQSQGFAKYHRRDCRKPHHDACPLA